MRTKKDSIVGEIVDITNQIKKYFDKEEVLDLIIKATNSNNADGKVIQKNNYLLSVGRVGEAIEINYFYYSTMYNIILENRGDLDIFKIYLNNNR